MNKKWKYVYVILKYAVQGDQETAAEMLFEAYKPSNGRSDCIRGGGQNGWFEAKCIGDPEIVEKKEANNHD